MAWSSAAKVRGQAVGGGDGSVGVCGVSAVGWRDQTGGWVRGDGGGGGRDDVGWRDTANGARICTKPDGARGRGHLPTASSAALALSSGHVGTDLSMLSSALLAPLRVSQNLVNGLMKLNEEDVEQFRVRVDAGLLDVHQDRSHDFDETFPQGSGHR